MDTTTWKELEKRMIESEEENKLLKDMIVDYAIMASKNPAKSKEDFEYKTKYLQLIRFYTKAVAKIKALEKENQELTKKNDRYCDECAVMKALRDLPIDFIIDDLLQNTRIIIEEDKVSIIPIE